MKHLDAQVKTLNFQVRQFCSSQYMDTELFAEYDIKRQAIQYLLSLHVASLERRVTVTAPASRWDAIKDLFVPRWARRWLPVRYRDLSAEAYALLPHMDLDNIQRKHEVRIAIHDTPRWWIDRGPTDE